jgi:hypothetical protein
MVAAAAIDDGDRMSPSDVPLQDLAPSTGEESALHACAAVVLRSAVDVRTAVRYEQETPADVREAVTAITDALIQLHSAMETLSERALEDTGAPHELGVYSRAFLRSLKDASRYGERFADLLEPSLASES